MNDRAAGADAPVPAPVRAIERVTDWAGTLAALLLAAQAGMMLAELAARNLMGRSLHVTWELSAYCMGGVFLFGAASALRHGDHVRVGLALEVLGPRAARILDLCVTLLGLVVASYLAWALAGLASRSLAGDVRSFSGYNIPIGVPQAALVAGTAILGLQLAARAVRLALGLPPDPGREDGGAGGLP